MINFTANHKGRMMHNFRVFMLLATGLLFIYCLYDFGMSYRAEDVNRAIHYGVLSIINLICLLAVACIRPRNQ